MYEMTHYSNMINKVLRKNVLFLKPTELSPDIIKDLSYQGLD